MHDMLQAPRNVTERFTLFKLSIWAWPPAVLSSRVLAGVRLPSNGKGAADVAAGTRGSCPVLAQTGTRDGRPLAAVAARESSWRDGRGAAAQPADRHSQHVSTHGSSAGLQRELKLHLG
jgi:hypothetical protein